MMCDKINKRNLLYAVIELLKMMEAEGNVEVSVVSKNKYPDRFSGVFDVESIRCKYHDVDNDIVCDYTLHVKRGEAVKLERGENDDKVNKIINTCFWSYLITVKSLLEYYYG